MTGKDTDGAICPAHDAAHLPNNYVKAMDAMAACVADDECVAWDDKWQALASYMRQADDKTLTILAKRIRARAQRRHAILSQQITSNRIEAAR